ncbi:uncharacterized protein LOC122008586 [Zingiber officinale]|uniref:RING-type domain-containing protein n=1 Tax=Zingiber officinale TaxID=94328 RepID=A0A8J5FUZ5_ZINOF|nr:uncharacterized protein LOC122008586 [Zingiber officinale]XP_042420288.1 uncharacterized protein LOC122008586 [Zingiber officinale]XP_042420289.1 uncharacterized protein LOC122008586 [Zingiber officinale]XP_042420290.1 uncharacterized protein LOC122008586 [Zingiber officinale]XP_042420291.1 uncharacterized protein LOC122008586 [Zingiber officinale]XP_042420292.1 uncharacterized protein LOC122008586 [Zingiber officinale]XP_042420293.1 uncharacterized protein LOC122008586 [Zingiber officinal
MDPSEPHWRTNSSYSPYLSRRWDCSSQSDELSNRVHEAPLTGSSVSLHSKSGRQTRNNDLIHHHSVSDGALSYSGSPSDYLQARRWIPCVHRYDLGEFSTPSGGARPEASFFSRGSEGCVAVANGIGSPFSPLESSRWASTSKQPRHLSNRRSFMSKPIYPLMFQNPVSDSDIPRMAEASTSGVRMHHENSGASPMWAKRTLSPELKFCRALTELRKMEASPDLSMSSRREGLRWSYSSSYDFRFDGDSVDITEAIDIENQRCPSNTTRYQRCEICKRLLRQKSPWSSNRIVRSTDMPVTGILPCHHVFHADCLEETTPKSQINEPPCPVCPKSLRQEKQTSFSEHAHVAFKSASSKGQGATVTSGSDTSRSLNPHQMEDDMRRNSSLAEPHHSSSSTKKHIKKRLSFKGKIGKDLLGAKMFWASN